MSIFEAKTLAVSANRSAASGNTSAFGSGTADKLHVGLNVTAFAGTTPTLDVKVEWSFDGGTTWFAHADDVFTQVGATTAQQLKEVPVRAPLFRLSWTIGGTGANYTFSAHGYLM